MQIILFDDAKQNLETICEQVCQDHEPYVVRGLSLLATNR